MRLSEGQSRKLLRTHGVYVTEVVTTAHFIYFILHSTLLTMCPPGMRDSALRAFQKQS
jgi:hypothetical protein